MHYFACPTLPPFHMTCYMESTSLDVYICCSCCLSLSFYAPFMPVVHYSCAHVATCGPRELQNRLCSIFKPEVIWSDQNWLEFLCLFCVVVILCSRWVLAFVVLGLVPSVLAKRLAGRTAPKWPILCWVGHNTLSQSQTNFMVTENVEQVTK